MCRSHLVLFYSILFCSILCFARRSVKALRRQPPVDSEDLSSDIARCRQTQKDDRIRYLFRARQPSHGGPSFDLVELGWVLRNGVLEHGCHLVVSVERGASIIIIICCCCCCCCCATHGWKKCQNKNTDQINRQG
jgi:hypothetical protein